MERYCNDREPCSQWSITHEIIIRKAYKMSYDVKLEVGEEDEVSCTGNVRV